MPKILYLIHGRALKESRVADRLRERGAEIEWCSHLDGDALPADVAPYDGIVVGGGLDSVNDAAERPYMARELAWVRQAVDAGKPYFGICLGAQILTAALGGKVGERPDRRVEVGYHPIAATEHGGALFAGLDQAYSFHGEGVVRLPEGAVTLARSPDFPNHAFRIGERVWGVQFHPDCRPDMLTHWFQFGGSLTERPVTQPLAEQHEASARYDPGMSRWLDRFLDTWLA
jgi:GMP synthase (glutamine-hydrolysing)